MGCKRGSLRLIAAWALLSAIGALGLPSIASAQLYGRNIAQPYFDFPPWARFSDCRPMPLAWGFDPFAPYHSCDGAEACVPDHCGKNQFVAHRPNGWYATVDYVPLTFDTNRDIEFARFGPLGPTVLSTSDLDVEFDSGAEVTIGRVIGDCWRIEATYLGEYSWDDFAVVQDSSANALGGTGNLSSLLSQFALPPEAGLDFNNFARVDSFASLRSAELNLRYWVEMPPGPVDVSVLVGARYLQFDDRIRFRSVADAPFPGGAVNQVTTQTENELWGVQLGIEGAILVTTHAWFDLDLKGAICQNTASQQTNYLNIDENAVATLFPTGREQERTSFLGDISLMFNVQCTPSTVFRVGYQATFLTGMAIAAENIETNNVLLRNGPGRLDDTGEMVYHGPAIGLTWAR
jgi:hypothetical protein